MATRSSARIRNIPAQAQVDVEQSDSRVVTKHKKQKSRPDSTEAETTKRRKLNHQENPPSLIKSKKGLDSLPDEIVEMIVHGVSLVATK
jgi:hypothetical protein